MQKFGDGAARTEQALADGRRVRIVFHHDRSGRWLRSALPPASMLLQPGRVVGPTELMPSISKGRA